MYHPAILVSRCIRACQKAERVQNQRVLNHGIYKQPKSVKHSKQAHGGVDIVSLGKGSKCKSEESAKNTKSSEKQEASENGQNASFSSSGLFDSNVDVTSRGAVPIRAFNFTGILLGSFFIFA